MDHKEVCARISNPQNANDELRLWCTFWAPSLMHATIWALDIKNNPGHNMKDAYVISWLSRLPFMTHFFLYIKPGDLCGEDGKD